MVQLAADEQAGFASRQHSEVSGVKGHGSWHNAEQGRCEPKSNGNVKHQAQSENKNMDAYFQAATKPKTKDWRVNGLSLSPEIDVKTDKGLKSNYLDKMHTF